MALDLYKNLTLKQKLKLLWRLRFPPKTIPVKAIPLTSEYTKALFKDVPERTINGITYIEAIDASGDIVYHLPQVRPDYAYRLRRVALQPSKHPILIILEHIENDTNIKRIQQASIGGL